MIVTLLTDFGTADHFVAAMKGVILRTDPRIRLVDISHEVPPHDVETAAFLLLSCYRDFPPDTVHLAVVDPGVGSDRRPIAVATPSYRFVGPDNGIFSHVLEQEPTHQIHVVENPRLGRQPFSSTFHGRDLFAPTAAVLARGLSLAEIGAAIQDPVRLRGVIERSRTGRLDARILHVDRFGNCVTNLRRSDLAGSGVRLRVAGVEIAETREHYGAGGTDEAFGIWGSSGFLEISVLSGSAAARLGVGRGEPIEVERV